MFDSEEYFFSRLFKYSFLFLQRLLQVTIPAVGWPPWPTVRKVPCRKVRFERLPASSARKCPEGRSRVWPLTQFYSVDFSKSRIGVKKCVFNKRTIKVCVIRSWWRPGTSVPSATNLLVSLFFSSSKSNTRGESRAREGRRVSSKSPSRVRDGDEGVAGRNRRE